MARIGSGLLIAAAALAAATPALADDPAVARPTLHLADEPVQRGLVFFVPANLPAGAAAIGTAHTFDLRDFARSQRVEFRLRDRTLATSSRLLAPPGRAFDAPGATLGGDFLIFALEEPPEGVRLLEIAAGPPATDTSVRVLGLDRKRGKPRTLRGRVGRASAGQIEVVIDGSPDLDGWGGAPVVDDDGRVLGMLQARWRSGATSQLAVAPLGDVLTALNRPLDGGAGQSFAQILEGRDEPSPARPPGVVPTRDVAPSLLEEVRLAIEYPSSGTVAENSTCGVFVAGRALAQELSIARFDVAIVIDTSESTQEASGADVDGDGTVGAARLGPVASLFSDGISDPDDSILAAEVAAARQLLFGLDPRSTRVTVITFAGGVPGVIPRWLGGRGRPAAIVRVPLSSDYEHVDRALQKIQSRAPAGATDMAAGLDLATRELLGRDGALSESDPETEKIVFFFTDGVPTLPHRGFEADNVREVLRAADRSRLGEVRVHAFAIGPEALEGPIAAIEMAQRTGGFFTPVRHPGSLKAAVERVSFANVDSIGLRNTTTGQPAHSVRTTADGSWAGFVPVADGTNRFEIIARSADGAEARASLVVRVNTSVPPTPVPAQLATRHNRLLEDCLIQAKRQRLDAEAEAAEEIRRELAVEIERERERALERAAEQRKNLELGIEQR